MRVNLWFYLFKFWLWSLPHGSLKQLVYHVHNDGKLSWLQKSVFGFTCFIVMLTSCSLFLGWGFGDSLHPHEQATYRGHNCRGLFKFGNFMMCGLQFPKSTYLKMTKIWVEKQCTRLLNLTLCLLQILLTYVKVSPIHWRTGSVWKHHPFTILVATWVIRVNWQIVVSFIPSLLLCHLFQILSYVSSIRRTSTRQIIKRILGQETGRHICTWRQQGNSCLLHLIYDVAKDLRFDCLFSPTWPFLLHFFVSFLQSFLSLFWPSPSSCPLSFLYF